jgi:MFS family permease
VSTAAAERPDGGEPRFRDTLRGLPPKVWIVSLGMLVNRTGNFLPVFMVLYLTSKNFSAEAAGLVLGAAGLGNVLGNAIGGDLADRLDRRWTIVLSMVATAGMTACIPLFDSLPSLILMVGLVRTTAQVFRPAAAALLVDGMTAQQRLAAAAVFRFAMNIGAAAGGVLGGFLATTSYLGMFIGNTIACLLFAVIAATLPRGGTRDGSNAGQGHSAGSAEREKKLGYRHALADRRLQRFLVMTLLSEIIWSQSAFGLPLHVSAIGLSPANFGLLMGLNGLLVVLFELPITSAVSRRRPEHVLAWSNVFTGVGIVLTGAANNMFWLVGTVLLWTLGEIMYSSVSAAHLGGLAPPNLVGRYQGLYGAAMTFGTGVGPLIGGLVYAYSEWVLWTICAIATVAAVRLCLPGRSQASPAVVPGA